MEFQEKIKNMQRFKDNLSTRNKEIPSGWNKSIE
jgi:hypothetical protein